MRPKLYPVIVALAMALVGGWFLPTPAGAQTVSGSYTGDGAASKAITGLGFQPDAVLIKFASGNPAVMATSTMPAGYAKTIHPGTAEALRTGLVRSLDADGFTVGNWTEVNLSGGTYYWVAWKAVPGEMAVGSYTGCAGSCLAPNPNANTQNITDVGFNPDYVIVMQSTTDGAGVGRPVQSFSGNAGYASQFNGHSMTINIIPALTASPNGFQVGSDSRSNLSGITYHYVAWKQKDGQMKVGRYQGNGTDGRTIAIPGTAFTPELVIVKADGGENAVHRPYSQGAGASDSSLLFISSTAVSDRIQTLVSGGFTVGGDFTVNKGGGGPWYNYAAFGKPACPVVNAADYVAASAVAQSNQASVYWSSPNPVLILRKKSAAVTDSITAAPTNGTDPNVGAVLDAGPPVTEVVFKGVGEETQFVDTVNGGCPNGTTCYYKVFPRARSGKLSCYGAGKEVNVTPSTTASPAWSYMLEGGGILKPGIAGEGTLHAGSQAGRFVSLSTATGAEKWPPVALTTTLEPLQGWPTWLPVGGYWKYRKKLTIQNGQVGGTLTDFPVLISHIDNDLRTKAQTSGNDIVFTAADGTTKLSHQIEKYDGLIGQLVAWVKVPSVSSSAPTDIYMYYGNSAAPNQEDAANVWDPNFMAVYHLKEDPTGAAPQVKDSTWNANHGTTEGTWTGYVPVNGNGNTGTGLAFVGDASSRLVRVPDSASLDSTTDAGTFELWVKWTSTTTTDGDSQIVMASSNRYHYSGPSASDLGGFEWTTGNDGRHFFYPWGDPSGNNNNRIGAPGPFTSGEWHHLVVTLDWAAKQVRIYVDGTSRSFELEGVNATNWTQLAFPVDWLWGGNPDRNLRYFDGVFDEIRVSNVVRSTAYITTTHKNQKCPSVQACPLTPFYTIESEEGLGGGAVAIMGDHSGRVYSMDTARAFKNWEATHAGADFLQAAVAAQVRAWSRSLPVGDNFQNDYSTDVIFVATRNAGATNCGTSATNNKLVALRADTKEPLWAFNGTCEHGSVNWIVGMPYVDYGQDRIYVASKSDGSQQSLWVISTRLAPASRLVTCPACTNSPPTGLMGVDLEGHSPTLSLDGATLYVGNKTGATGKLYAINAADLTLKWTFDLGAGAFIKGFVWEDAGKLYFSTSDGYLWCLDASLGAPAAPPGSPSGSCPWKSNAAGAYSPVTGATTPLLLGAPYPGLYVGSYDSGAASGQKGKLYRINRTTGLKETQVVVGNGEKVVGDVSTETWGEVFVGTSEGKIFKLPLPLP